MEPSRMDVSLSFVACSRVFSERDVLSEVKGLQSSSQALCLSVSARSSANQSSRGAATKANTVPPQSGGAPRASSLSRTAHQQPTCRQLSYCSQS